MSRNIHITEDGPKPCNAQPGNCPIGGEHYSNVNEAVNAYETQMKSQMFSTAKKQAETPTQTEKTATYIIAKENYAKAQSLINRLNKRLEKAGIEERFEATFTEEYKIVVDDSLGVPIEQVTPYYKVTLDRPSISYNGYRFNAMMEKVENGFITKNAPGVNLHGWRPEKMVCEHCGHNRARSKTYLIEGPDGQKKQIGSTCVDAYLGMSPEGLKHLFNSPLDTVKIHEDDDDYRIKFSAGGNYRTDQMLSIALAVSDNGHKFVSSSNGNPNQMSTAGLTTLVLEGGIGVDPDWRREMLQKARTITNTGEIEKLKAMISELPDNDYGTNMKVLSSGKATDIKHINFLASAVSLVNRKERAERIQREKEARQKAKEDRIKNSVKGFIGEPNEKLPKGMKMTVVSARTYETPGYTYNSDMVTKTAVTLRTEDGHMATWFANKQFEEDELREGGVITISSGSIKKHDVYEGVDQTVLTRLRFTMDE